MANIYGLRKKTVKELREMAKNLEIRRYSKMTKDALINAIASYMNEECKAEENEEITMVETKTVIVNEDEKKANGDKLVKMLISAWIYTQRSEYYYTDSTGQTHESKYHLFFWSKKYNSMIASRKALMKVTNDAIVATFGEEYAYSETNNNYWLILKAYETVAYRGFCSVKDSDVFISVVQWDKMNKQVDLLQKNAIAAGCKTLKEYICK